MTVGLASFAFYLTMCLMRRIRNRAKLKISKQLCTAVSGIAFAMPLAFGLNKIELQIFKLLLYPLAFRCLVNYLQVKSGIPSFSGGDILSYMVVTFCVTYCYMLEGRSGKSLQNMIDTISHARFTKQKVPRVYPAAHR